MTAPVPAQRSSSHIIGIDVGGTFTDAVVLDGDTGQLLAAFKLPSTPGAPGGAVVEALDRIAAEHDVAGSLVCHGTTVGTNALIERRGETTALVTTRGFADVIELRRQARPRLYDLAVRISPPLVAPEHRFEIDERLDAEGKAVAPLAGLEEVVDAVSRSGARSIAVSLLHSYRNEAHERAVVEALRAALPEAYVTRSSAICPEIGEYERTSTAVVNSYIGPIVARYMAALDRDLAARRVAQLLVVKSDGGLTTPAHAAGTPAHLIESGPAAGLAATAAFARHARSADNGRRADYIAFDMGGTTAKAGLIRDGEPETASEFHADRFHDGRDIGGYAIRSPILRLLEIGAGGGSLAFIDPFGVLKVGPRSAGADPGPACYGRGGTLPTVTDAHAVIGTLLPEFFAGTGIAFARAPAEAAIGRHVAEPYGWPLARAAHAIIDLAVASMAGMVRLATVERGLDPRDFALLASGGAGPLHATRVAAEVGVSEVVIPPNPGMFSALGATLGVIRHEVSRSLLRLASDVDAGEVEEGFREVERRARDLLAEEPGRAAPRYERSVDARFAGQLFEIRFPLPPGPIRVPELEREFRARYRGEYGFDLAESQVQLVTLRVVATKDIGSAAMRALSPRGRRAEPVARRRVPLLDRHGVTVEVPLLSAATRGSVAGPALIAHHGSTVWIQDGQVADFGADGRVTIEVGRRA